MRRRRTHLITDERAIEGLPIRLVIALVVGVAALGIMMSVLGGITDFGDEEVTVQMDEELIYSDESITVTVVTEEGDPVSDAMVLVSSGSLTLQDGPVPLDASNGSVRFDLTDHSVDFRADQNRGTLQFEVIPPSDSDYVDTASNPEVTVIER